MYKPFYEILITVCRVAIIVALCSGFYSYWETWWMPILGLLFTPFSTVIYFCLKYMAIEPETIKLLVMLSLVFEIVCGIMEGEKNYKLYKKNKHEDDI